jgi:hypothetical protein
MRWMRIWALSMLVANSVSAQSLELFTPETLYDLTWHILQNCPGAAPNLARRGSRFEQLD